MGETIRKDSLRTAVGQAQPSNQTTTLVALLIEQPMVIDIPGSEALSPLSAVDLHHVSTTVPVTPKIAKLLKQADVMTFSFKGLVTPSVGQVSFDLTGSSADWRLHRRLPMRNR